MFKRKYKLDLNDRINFVANVGVAFLGACLKDDVLTGELKYQAEKSRMVILDILDPDEIEYCRSRAIESAERVQKVIDEREAQKNDQ